jgi:hypothetical protein
MRSVQRTCMSYAACVSATLPVVRILVIHMLCTVLHSAAASQEFAVRLPLLAAHLADRCAMMLDV